VIRRTCGTYGRQMFIVILVGRPEGCNRLEDLGVDGSMILKLILKNWDGGVDWIGLAQ